MARGFDAEDPDASRFWSAPARLSRPTGYEAARTADIAERAGVSERLLYKHFTGKQELFLAVAERDRGHRRRGVPRR